MVGKGARSVGYPFFFCRKAGPFRRSSEEAGAGRSRHVARPRPHGRAERPEVEPLIPAGGRRARARQLDEHGPRVIFQK